MKIYTKTGDRGKTGILGGRVDKMSTRISLLGEIDELNAQLGVATNVVCDDCMIYEFTQIQHWLMKLSSIIAKKKQPQEPNCFVVQDSISNYINDMEKLIDKMDEELPELKNFILPGGFAAPIHLARAITRRVERLLWLFVSEHDGDDKKGARVIYVEIGKVFNRLSDLLFTTARYVNFKLGCEDVIHHC